MISFRSLCNFENLKAIRALLVLILNRSTDGIKRYLINVLLTVLETLYLINNSLPSKGSLIAELLELI